MLALFSFLFILFIWHIFIYFLIKTIQLFSYKKPVNKSKFNLLANHLTNVKIKSNQKLNTLTLVKLQTPSDTILMAREMPAHPSPLFHFPPSGEKTVFHLLQVNSASDDTLPASPLTAYTAPSQLPVSR